MPGARCNRRGFSAEKQVLLPSSSRTSYRSRRRSFSGSPPLTRSVAPPPKTGAPASLHKFAFPNQRFGRSLNPLALGSGFVWIQAGVGVLTDCFSPKSSEILLDFGTFRRLQAMKSSEFSMHIPPRTCPKPDKSPPFLQSVSLNPPLLNRCSIKKASRGAKCIVFLRILGDCFPAPRR